VEAKGVITYEGQLLTSISIDMALTTVAKVVGQDALAGSKSALVGQYRGYAYSRRKSANLPPWLVPHYPKAP
jgi:hypothetical protein